MQFLEPGSTGIDWLDAPLSCERKAAMTAHWAVLRQRAALLRERLSCVPFHARKVAMLKAEGKDEIDDYWIWLVPQRVDEDEMPCVGSSLAASDSLRA